MTNQNTQTTPNTRNDDYLEMLSRSAIDKILDESADAGRFADAVAAYPPLLLKYLSHALARHEQERIEQEYLEPEFSSQDRFCKPQGVYSGSWSCDPDDPEKEDRLASLIARF